MKKILLLSALIGANIFQVHAQQKEGMNHIEKMCGCFSVNFKYAETFSPDLDYKFHDREEMNAVELALPIEKTDNKIVIQHLLVINDTMIIKHWREEWSYESPVIYKYTDHRTWKKEKLTAAEVKNKWTQTIWEVGDEPRYQGVSAWITNDDMTYWESTADAPLPRREYSVRSDYNIMKRRNRIVITDDGYVHEQDNDKVIRADKKDKLLAQEKGFNTYVSRKDKDCKSAENWWKKNEAFWAIVRNDWGDIINTSSSLNLKWKVDGKMMHEHLDGLWKEWRTSNLSSAEVDRRVKEIINQFRDANS